MRLLRLHGLPGMAGLFAVALAAAVGGTVAPALAASPTASGPVSPTPVPGTPKLAPSTKFENISQLVQCGSMMYAVGTFTAIKHDGQTYSRNNAFSFKATSPYTVSSWNPDVNGTVNSITFNGTGCLNAYIGGQFTSVHGTAAKNIAKVSIATGTVVSAFGHNVDGAVNTVLATHNSLLVGGNFTSINGGGNPRFASLDLNTGKDDGYLTVKISGDIPGGPTGIYNQQLSNNGNLLLAEGNFTSVSGQPRQQIFMLNLAASPAKITGWYSTGFNQACYKTHPFYVHDAAWSPDDSTVYVATTGFHLASWHVGGSYPLTGLCDVAAAFPATQQTVTPRWINYTGCYSLFSVAADSSAVYVGGHQRYEDNANDCKGGGPGSVADSGLAGLSPSTGKALVNSNGTARYTMARANADDMLVTSGGLWIASSNRFNANTCGGTAGLQGICYLPYP